MDRQSDRLRGKPAARECASSAKSKWEPREADNPSRPAAIGRASTQVPSSGESARFRSLSRRSRRRRHGTAPVRSQGPQGNRGRRDEISVHRAGWQAPRAGGPRPGPERNRLRPSPGFALIDASSRFPILHNAEETICRPYKAAQLRHSAYCSHLQRAMRYS